MVENFPSKHRNLFTKFYNATSCKVGNCGSHEITFESKKSTARILAIETNTLVNFETYSLTILQTHIKIQRLAHAIQAFSVVKISLLLLFRKAIHFLRILRCLSIHSLVKKQNSLKLKQMPLGYKCYLKSYSRRSKFYAVCDVNIHISVLFPSLCTFSRKNICLSVRTRHKEELKYNSTHYFSRQ